MANTVVRVQVIFLSCLEIILLHAGCPASGSMPTSKADSKRSRDTTLHAILCHILALKDWQARALSLASAHTYVKRIRLFLDTEVSVLSGHLNICVLQIKARLYSIAVFALCLILLVFVKLNSCATYIQTWLGLGPMAAMETATVISNMFFYMPKTPDLKEPMIQVS